MQNEPNSLNPLNHEKGLDQVAVKETESQESFNLDKHENHTNSFEKSRQKRDLQVDFARDSREFILKAPDIFKQANIRTRKPVQPYSFYEGN